MEKVKTIGIFQKAYKTNGLEVLLWQLNVLFLSNLTNSAEAMNLTTNQQKLLMRFDEKLSFH